jgi:hypothetical protein
VYQNQADLNVLVPTQKSPLFPLRNLYINIFKADFRGLSGMQFGLNSVNMLTYTWCLFFRHCVVALAGIGFQLFSWCYSTMLSTEVVG